jgi:hypothetical protein
MVGSVYLTALYQFQVLTSVISEDGYAWRRRKYLGVSWIISKYNYQYSSRETESNIFMLWLFLPRQNSHRYPLEEAMRIPPWSELVTENWIPVVRPASSHFTDWAIQIYHYKKKLAEKIKLDIFGNLRCRCFIKRCMTSRFCKYYIAAATAGGCLGCSGNVEQ